MSAVDTAAAERTDRQLGVTVDDVDEVLTVSPDQLEAVPSAKRDSIEAIAKVGDRMVILLNPAGLFSDAA